MGQERRQFTDELKTEAVALLASSGRPLLQIASERGSRPRCCATGATAVRGGMRGRAAALPSIPDPAAEISRLRRENDRLRLERDILEKAVAIFSEPAR